MHGTTISGIYDQPRWILWLWIVDCGCLACLVPWCSIYGIFTHIDPWNNTNVCKYSIDGASGLWSQSALSLLVSILSWAPLLKPRTSKLPPRPCTTESIGLHDSFMLWLLHHLPIRMGGYHLISLTVLRFWTSENAWSGGWKWKLLSLHGDPWRACLFWVSLRKRGTTFRAFQLAPR